MLVSWISQFGNDLASPRAGISLRRSMLGIERVGTRSDRMSAFSKNTSLKLLEARQNRLQSWPRECSCNG